MAKRKDLTGLRSGSLIAISFDEKLSKLSRKNYWVCKCDCGNFKSYEVSRITGHFVTSCGCKQHYKKHFIHGQTNTRLYNIWCRMKSRCNTPTASHYDYYGGRGISVCDEWNSSFIAFYEWALSAGYKNSLSIDRIDPNGNYCPDNCRWVPLIEQSRNKRNSTIIKIGDCEIPSAQIAKSLNIPTTIISTRYKSLLKRGEEITMEKLTYPYKPRKKSDS